MRILVDGQPQSEELQGTSATLVAALAAAREQARGRMIVEIMADGLPVPACDLESPPEDTPYANQIEFTTAAESDLIRDALGQIDTSLARLPADQNAIASSLDTGDIPMAMESLGDVLSSWDAVQQFAVILARAVEGNKGQQATISQQSTELLGALTDVREAVLNEDWSTLSDVLSYELADLAVSWRGTINSAGKAVISDAA